MKSRVLKNYLLYDGEEKNILRDLMNPLGISLREIPNTEKIIAATIVSGNYKVIALNDSMFSTLEDKLFTLSYLIADYTINASDEYRYVFSISNLDVDVYKFARRIYERRLLYSNISREELKKVLK